MSLYSSKLSTCGCGSTTSPKASNCWYSCTLAGGGGVGPGPNASKPGSSVPKLLLLYALKSSTCAGAGISPKSSTGVTGGEYSLKLSTCVIFRLGPLKSSTCVTGYPLKSSTGASKLSTGLAGGAAGNGSGCSAGALPLSSKNSPLPLLPTGTVACSTPGRLVLGGIGVTSV